MKHAKRVIFMVGGGVWLLFSLGFGLILVRYVAGGAGLQLFGGPVSSESVLIGLAHTMGFVVAMVICFAIGAGLCARGLVLDPQEELPKAGRDPEPESPRTLANTSA